MESCGPWKYPPQQEHRSPIVREPETRPISQEQLVAEVKGIYAGLVMVEAKCIEVDNAQSQKQGQPLTHDQWQALIALHRTLLNEHHDFFLASEHPYASPALRRLASKYAMPARMWRHGIHSFLELLRHRLPQSLEHMLTFIYLAYSMMALLYETVPESADTWIECLGDLGRYRMAVEDDNRRDRDIWTEVSRHWYSTASDRSPTTGRLYHHLAILARPNGLQQPFYYCKSLCVPVPFKSAKESILTLFNPVLNPDPGQPPFYGLGNHDKPERGGKMSVVDKLWAPFPTIPACLLGSFSNINRRIGHDEGHSTRHDPGPFTCNALWMEPLLRSSQSWMTTFYQSLKAID